MSANICRNNYCSLKLGFLLGGQVFITFSQVQRARFESSYILRGERSNKMAKYLRIFFKRKKYLKKQKGRIFLPSEYVLKKIIIVR